MSSAASPGWSSLLVYRVDNDPVVDAVTFAASPDQVVVVVDAGRKTIEARGDGGRWHRSQYEPGQVAMTAPGQQTRLRWRGVDRVQTTQMHLPGALIDSVALQLRGRDATALRRPDALSTVGPVLAALARVTTQVAVTAATYSAYAGSKSGRALHQGLRQGDRRTRDHRQLHRPGTAEDGPSLRRRDP